MKRAYSRFAAVLLAAFAVFFVSMAGSWLLIQRANDPAEPAALVRQLRDSGGLASTLSVPHGALKRTLFHAVKPEVVTVGSSTSLQIRQDFFTRSFVNLGGLSVGVTGDLEYLFAVADQWFVGHAPRTIILPLNYFKLFHDGSARLDPRPRNVVMAEAGGANPLLLPLRLLQDGRARPGQLLDILLGRQPADYHGLPLHGLGALLQPGAGIGPDGSTYQFPQTLNQATTPVAGRFGDDLACMKRPEGCPPYYGDYRVDERKIALVRTFIEEMRQRGIHVIVYLAPFPPAMIDAMRRGPYWDAVAGVRDALRRSLPEVHDYFDARVVGADDCGFIDAVHPSEAVNLRIFAAIADTDPAMRDILDPRAVARARAADATFFASADAVSAAMAPAIARFKADDVCRNPRP